VLPYRSYLAELLLFESDASQAATYVYGHSVGTEGKGEETLQELVILLLA